MLQQTYAIARNAFQESIRQPIFVVLLLTGTLVLLLLNQLALFTMDDDNKLLAEVSLSTVFFAGAALAAFTATGVLADELENRTVLTVVSKPVPRPVLVVGKYLGVAGALMLAMWVLTMVMLLLTRHGSLQNAYDQIDGPVLVLGLLGGLAAIAIACAGNYLYRWVFPSSLSIALALGLALAYLLVLVIGKGWKFQSIAAEFRDTGSLKGGQMLIALAMVYLGVMMLVAVAIAASTRMGQMLTLAVVAVYYLGGQFTSSLLARHRDDSAIANAFYWITPNLQYLWQGEALTQGSVITLSHLALVSLYALLHILAILLLAIALFQTREVG